MLSNSFLRNKTPICKKTQLNLLFLLCIQFPTQTDQGENVAALEAKLELELILVFSSFGHNLAKNSFIKKRNKEDSNYLLIHKADQVSLLERHTAHFLL